MNCFEYLIDYHGGGSFGLFVCDGMFPFCCRKLDDPHIFVKCRSEGDERIFEVKRQDEPIESTLRMTESEFREFLSKVDPENYK